MKTRKELLELREKVSRLHTLQEEMNKLKSEVGPVIESDDGFFSDEVYDLYQFGDGDGNETAWYELYEELEKLAFAAR